MLLIELAKAPPPVPLNQAPIKSVLKGVVFELKAIAVQIMAMVSMTLEFATTLRPPTICVMNELTILIVPPERPATAGKVYNRTL